MIMLGSSCISFHSLRYGRGNNYREIYHADSIAVIVLGNFKNVQIIHKMFMLTSSIETRANSNLHTITMVQHITFNIQLASLT